MNWLSENYKWLFDGVAGAAIVAIIVVLFQKWLKSSAQPSHEKGNLMAQGAKVTNSPVASGSGITQTVSETHHHHYREKPLEQIGQTGEVEPPRANITFCGVTNICVRESEGGLFFQDDNGDIVAIAQFSNDALIGAKNKEAVVKAAVIYRDGARELMRVTGCWLGSGAGEVRFRVDDSHKLMIGLILGGELYVLQKREVFAHRRTAWFTDLHRLGEMPRVTVLVRLTGASSGYCYFEGNFEVTTNPLNIRSVTHT